MPRAIEKSDLVSHTDLYLSTKDWAVLGRHLRMLGLDREIEQIHTLGDLKRRAKEQFQILIRLYHPDTSGARPPPGYFQARGRNYGTLLQAHRWIQDLTQAGIDKIAKRGETVPDPPCPAWGRPLRVALPWGYQEDFEWILSANESPCDAG